MTPAQVDPIIESIYHWLDLSGVLIMGTIGGTIARQRGYDIVGFLFIAMVSALGGGMLRDVLINEGTVAAMSEPAYLILAFTGALIGREPTSRATPGKKCATTVTRLSPPCGPQSARSRRSRSGYRFCRRS